MRAPLLLLVLASLACSDAAVGMSESDEGSTDDGSTGGDGDGDSGGTGDGDGTTGTTTGDGDGDGTITCADVGEGWNRGLLAGGMPRDFIVHLPDGADAGGPWPVVFNWHGLGDTADNMDGLVAPFVNGAWPFISVTPEDTNYELTVPLLGTLPMDWEVFMVQNGSRETELFDAVLECLDQRWNIDLDHVHSMGFSLGSITSDMIGTMRGDAIASIATYSGGYWSNLDNLDAILSAQITWPEHTTANKYAQLFLHGGPTDNFPLGPIAIQFDEYAVADTAWLNAKGHDVVICDHGGGHSAPPAAMGPDKLLAFLRDHPRGVVDSPYAAGLPADYASYCSFSPKTP